MSAEGHQSLGSRRDPLIPTIMHAIVMNQDILSVMVDGLSFDPLAGGIPDIDPLPYLDFPPLQPKRTDILHKVQIDALNQLVNCMFVLLQDLD